jgi:hypothetical protein
MFDLMNILTHLMKQDNVYKLRFADQNKECLVSIND